MDITEGRGRQAANFLPDLCTPQAVFALVVVGELLAIALVVADTGLRKFSWEQLATTSFLVLWVALISAALICPLRPFLSHRPPLLAGSLSYGLVLLVTLVFSAVGQWVRSGHWFGALDLWSLGSSLLIAAIFAGIILRYFYLQQQLHNQQKAELQARIQALQSRIRPHFLFNSMNSIASLIETDPHTAERVVEDLSDLFRASLAEPALIPIDDELAISRRYINIEQLRLGERLQVNWHIGDLPPGAKIPSLLLQPLLENAIYHGIQPSAEGGTVELDVQSSDNQLQVTVRNPVQPRVVPPTVERRRGNRMALDNIRYRLAAQYGSRAALKAQRYGDIFVTTITIPAPGYKR